MELKHSGLGVASTVLSLVMGGIIFIVCLISALFGYTFGEDVQKSTVGMVLFFSVLACLITCIAGLVLGILGLLQKERKRLFPILGIVINSVILLIGFTVYLIAVFM